MFTNAVLALDGISVVRNCCLRGDGKAWIEGGTQPEFHLTLESPYVETGKEYELTLDVDQLDAGAVRAIVSGLGIVGNFGAAGTGQSCTFTANENSTSICFRSLTGTIGKVSNFSLAEVPA